MLAFIGSNALPLNVGGLLLILIGIGLLALELVVTSYGLLTVGGIVAFVLGAFALWTGVTPGVDAIDVSVSPWIIAVVAAVGGHLRPDPRPRVDRAAAHGRRVEQAGDGAARREPEPPRR